MTSSRTIAARIILVMSCAAAAFTVSSHAVASAMTQSRAETASRTASWAITDAARLEALLRMHTVRVSRTREYAKLQPKVPRVPCDIRVYLAGDAAGRSGTIDLDLCSGGGSPILVSPDLPNFVRG